MPYTPKTWENKPSTASPINATNLNHMEGGIKTNDDNIVDAQNAILTLQGEMLQAQGDISALETLVDSILPVDTESGNPAVITDAFGGACKSLKLTLEPIQSGSGTPSPQNDRPISGRTEANINATGRNLYIGSPSFDGYSNLSNWALQTETYNGHEVYKNVGGWNGLNKTIYLKAGTYTFSCMVKGSQANTPLYIFNASNTILLSTTVGTSWQKVSAVLNQGTDSNVTLRVETSGATPSLYVSEYMLEMGSEATPYQEWGETITRTYGTTIYGGTDDVTGDGAVNTRGIAVANDFSGSWYGLSAGGLHWGDLSVANIDITAPAISSMLPYKESETAWNSTTSCFTLNNTGIRVYVEESTIADFKANYANLQICYTLATPTSIPLTSQNITLLHGDNVITTDADSIECEYSADIALYIAKKIAEGSNNRSLSKGGSSESTEEETKEEKEEEEIEEPKKEETR